MFNTSRGTGRTTKVINALPINSAFVVHSLSIKPLVQSYLKSSIRDDIRVVTVDESWDYLRCHDVHNIGIDHVVFEDQYINDFIINAQHFLRYISNIYYLDGDRVVRQTGSDWYDANH